MIAACDACARSTALQAGQDTPTVCNVCGGLLRIISDEAGDCAPLLPYRKYCERCLSERADQQLGEACEICGVEIVKQVTLIVNECSPSPKEHVALDAFAGNKKIQSLRQGYEVFEKDGTACDVLQLDDRSDPDASKHTHRKRVLNENSGLVKNELGLNSDRAVHQTPPPFSIPTRPLDAAEFTEIVEKVLELAGVPHSVIESIDFTAHFDPTTDWSCRANCSNEDEKREVMRAMNEVAAKYNTTSTLVGK